MRILVTNDDGITAQGIVKLAMFAMQFGEVTVVAPDHQCSAMSQRITLGTGINITETTFAIKSVKAYSIDGTPADCVRVGLGYIMKDGLPDYVFSGINNGYNAGYDIAYSGTVGAAMEAVMSGVPAIAFSTDFTTDYHDFDDQAEEIVRKILSQKPLDHGIWNLNFPGRPGVRNHGIKWGMKPARSLFVSDTYKELERTGMTVKVVEQPHWTTDSPEGTDIDAILHNYTSVGTVDCLI